VGCIIADEDAILAKSYRIHSGGDSPNETDHAEMNALRRLPRDELEKKNSPLTVFSTMEPCLMCFGALLINGIHNIVYAYEDVMGGGTGINLADLSPLYNTQKVNIVSNILREESLNLFKTFFKNPENPYWKESLLARYTLNQ
jgi:tRNA(adenine34) deaminase